MPQGDRHSKPILQKPGKVWAEIEALSPDDPDGFLAQLKAKVLLRHAKCFKRMNLGSILGPEGPCQVLTKSVS